MSPYERRQEIIQILCRKRQETMQNLADEFCVSLRTICSDVEILTLSYPLDTVRGRYGGGVKIADWYHLNRDTLNPKQTALLKALASTLQGDDLTTMNGILSRFAPYEAQHKGGNL
ncbi:MAG: HTH domain-containing protein [Ruthenibacterium sp.]